jgi:hypothetical protein
VFIGLILIDDILMRNSLREFAYRISVWVCPGTRVARRLSAMHHRAQSNAIKISPVGTTAYIAAPDTAAAVAGSSGTNPNNDNNINDNNGSTGMNNDAVITIVGAARRYSTGGHTVPSDAPLVISSTSMDDIAAIGSNNDHNNDRSINEKKQRNASIGSIASGIQMTQPPVAALSSSSLE